MGSLKSESPTAVVLYGPLSGSNIGLTSYLLPLPAEKKTMEAIHLFNLTGIGL